MHHRLSRSEVHSTQAQDRHRTSEVKCSCVPGVSAKKALLLRHRRIVLVVLGTNKFLKDVMLRHSKNEPWAFIVYSRLITLTILLLVSCCTKQPALASSHLINTHSHCQLQIRSSHKDLVATRRTQYDIRTDRIKRWIDSFLFIQIYIDIS